MTDRNAEIIQRIIARNADEKQALIERRNRLHKTGVSIAKTSYQRFLVWLAELSASLQG